MAEHPLLRWKVRGELLLITFLGITLLTYQIENLFLKDLCVIVFIWILNSSSDTRA